MPISVLDPVPLLKILDNLYNNKVINLKKFSVRGHPALKNNFRNNHLINKINNFIKKLPKKNKFKYNSNVLLFVGISGAIVEELEKGSKVIQISENPIFDTYSNKFYPSLIKKKISSNIYTYNLKKKGNLIKFGKRRNNVKNIISL